MGASLAGFVALGLTWDEVCLNAAVERAKLCSARSAEFQIQDIRRLDDRKDLEGGFDVVVCCEVIEHILNDEKVMADLRRCLREGGTLLMTAPNLDYLPITPGDAGPFSQTEDGWHVRKGYSEGDFRRLCGLAGFTPTEVGYCSGWASQKATWVLRTLSRLHPLIGWAVVLPLRAVALVADGWLDKLLGWPGYSITLVARATAVSALK
jgi:SAM-dependent methyltransferase